MVRERTALEVVRRHGIPVTTPALTLVDLSARLTRAELEAAINEADKRDLTDPDALRNALDRFVGRPGVAILRSLLDRRTFTLTESDLERRFLPIAARAGLSQPETGTIVIGYKVDFCWPDLGLVVETDGLRYHRTPAQQAKDRERDHAFATAGIAFLRFTHAHVAYEPGYVEQRLVEMARRLSK